MLANFVENLCYCYVSQLVCFNKLPLVVTILADRKANTGMVVVSCHSSTV